MKTENQEIPFDELTSISVERTINIFNQLGIEIEGYFDLSHYQRRFLGEVVVDYLRMKHARNMEVTHIPENEIEQVSKKANLAVRRLMNE